MPALAQDFEVIAVDQRGIGLTDKPQDGYDTGTLADDMVALMDALGHERFAVVGHDTGFAIGYALAADHPERVDRVALAEIPGPPGTAASPPVFVPAPSTTGCGTSRSTGSQGCPSSSSPGARTSTLATSSPIQGGTAARRGDRLLRRPRLEPGLPARQPRVLPGLRRHAGAERAAQPRQLAMPVLAIGGEASYGDACGGGDESRSPTTCRPWSSPAPATGSPRRPRTRC